jgi:hypothetical protein
MVTFSVSAFFQGVNTSALPSGGSANVFIGKNARLLES